MRRLVLDDEDMEMAQGDGPPHVMFCGLWYRDRFVRTGEGWRIAERYERPGLRPIYAYWSPAGDRLAMLLVFGFWMQTAGAPTLPPEAVELIHGLVTLDDGAPLTVIDVGRLLASERLRPFSRPS